jgi:hypothetical protein
VGLWIAVGAAERWFYAMETVQEEELVPVRWSAARGLAGTRRDLPAMEGEREVEQRRRERKRVVLGGVGWFGLNQNFVSSFWGKNPAPERGLIVGALDRWDTWQLQVPRRN